MKGFTTKLFLWICLNSMSNLRKFSHSKLFTYTVCHFVTHRVIYTQPCAWAIRLAVFSEKKYSYIVTMFIALVHNHCILLPFAGWPLPYVLHFLFTIDDLINSCTVTMVTNDLLHAYAVTNDDWPMGQYSTTRPDRHILIVGAISGPHCQISALHWNCFTSCEFTWLAKSTGKADQLTLASGGSEHT